MGSLDEILKKIVNEDPLSEKEATFSKFENRYVYRLAEDFGRLIGTEHNSLALFVVGAIPI